MDLKSGMRMRSGPLKAVRLSLLVALVLAMLWTLAPENLWADVRPRIHDAERDEAARQRLYPGGVDEEDLQVLPSLPTAERRMDAATLRAQVMRESGRQAPARQVPAPSSADEAEDGD